MTTANARVRGAALAAGLAGALALTACGGGSGDGGSGGSGEKAGAPASPGTSAGTASPGVTGAAAGLQGSWITTADGKIVALVVTGKQAGVFVTGGTVCSGTAGAEDRMQMIHLTCRGGGKERTTGMVDSVNGTTLKVTWSGETGQETYTKAEGGKLPSGLPTAPAKR
ncbi:hypothetical protein [Streptomyces sp. NRRL S-1022]|uniref:hypothetical protein n=1 Tax=Streptomyces sp. NRRL S-1022 TaxID=1463880 RepID=UPI001F3FD20B|nr:hypothetical protein [Streptomyces sp. NRRL S-1022]